MIRTFVLACFAVGVLVSCVSDEPYLPVTKPEQREFARDRLDVYPDDIRKNPAAYTNTVVVWAGIITSTDAREEDTGGKIVADTVFEHHYFDWVQNGAGHRVKLAVSPRGEGFFRARWHLDKIGRDATAENAEKYAAPGNLAIIYGVPDGVDPDGTVVLKYRYLRILDANHFDTNEFDYGRLGESFRALHPSNNTNSPPATAH